MAVRPDSEIIQEAYESSVGRIYSTFFEAMTLAESGELEKQAQEGFSRGLQLARKVRDTALQLI